MRMAVESSRLLFHWLLVGSFAGAFILAEDGGAVHEALGYIALGLVIARIVWGFIGTKYARFAEFVPSPGQLFGYLRDVVARRAISATTRREQ
jgi:cytochrome b